MILMRMLSVSRSFCARVPELGRYRMTGGLRLPRFGTAAKGKGERRVAIQGELPIAAVPVVAGAEAMAASGQREKGGSPARMGWWQWWRWVWRGGANWRGKSAKPHRRPVQTAFLLESVKVMRNDLADADLELVRTKKRRPTVSEPRLDRMKNPAAGEDRPGLGRTAVRWLTAGRMS